MGSRKKKTQIQRTRPSLRYSTKGFDQILGNRKRLETVKFHQTTGNQTVMSGRNLAVLGGYGGRYVPYPSPSSGGSWWFPWWRCRGSPSIASKARFCAGIAATKTKINWIKQSKQTDYTRLSPSPEAAAGGGRRWVTVEHRRLLLPSAARRETEVKEVRGRGLTKFLKIGINNDFLYVLAGMKRKIRRYNWVPRFILEGV